MADRILVMAEKQSEHRQKLEAKVVRSDVFKSYLGMFFATVIVISGIVAAILIALFGNSTNSKLLAGFIVAFDFSAVALIAAGNKKAQDRQLEHRRTSSLAPPK